MGDERLDWLAEAHESERIMSAVANELLAVAERLAYFAPQSPAIYQLKWSATSLATQSKRLREAVGNKVGDDCRQAGESSGLLLKASIAGAIGATDDPDRREALARLGGFDAAG